MAHILAYPRRVAKINRNADCTPSGQPTDPPIQNYKWDFYVLHVLHSEVGGEGYNQAAMRAFESLVQNYGWYHKLLGGSYDVDWSTNFQCFRPRARVKRSWRTWLGAVLVNRIADGSSRIRETQYRAGRYLFSNCAEDPNFPRNGNLASQKGIKSLTTLGSCGPLMDWRDVVDYYYTWSVVPVNTPVNPVTSFSTKPDSITFTFQSYAGTFHLAWGYEVDKRTGSSWTRIYRRGWRRSTRHVPTSWTYPTTGCARYRARAYNPAGYSVYSSFNGGNQICTG